MSGMILSYLHLSHIHGNFQQIFHHTWIVWAYFCSRGGATMPHFSAIVQIGASTPQPRQIGKSFLLSPTQNDQKLVVRALICMYRSIHILYKL